jgi:CheY-like chemotaxis protein
VKSRILIVEDEQIIAEDLAIQVRRLGHEVLGISSSGEEAIAFAEQSTPDLVVMDVQLEGPMTGAQAAHIIRERTGAAIVFVTAFPSALLRAGPHPPQSDICVSKPFSRMQLETALRTAGERREK